MVRVFTLGLLLSTVARPAWAGSSFCADRARGGMLFGAHLGAAAAAAGSYGLYRALRLDAPSAAPEANPMAPLLVFFGGAALFAGGLVGGEFGGCALVDRAGLSEQGGWALMGGLAGAAVGVALGYGLSSSSPQLQPGMSLLGGALTSAAGALAFHRWSAGGRGAGWETLGAWIGAVVGWQLGMLVALSRYGPENIQDHLGPAFAMGAAGAGTGAVVGAVASHLIKTCHGEDRAGPEVTVAPSAAGLGLVVSGRF